MASSKRTVYGPAALPYFNSFFSEVVSLAAVVSAVPEAAVPVLVVSEAAVVVSVAAEVEELPEQAVKSPVVSTKDAAKVVLT